jgi:type IV secretion system protein VirD4
MSILLGWPLEFRAAESSNPHAFRNRDGEWRGTDLSFALDYRGDGHLITFAPTGAGKGVGSIIPNLLNYDGPVIVIDPKGENFAVTARYRHDVLKQQILLFDPFEYVPDSLIEEKRMSRARINPFDLGGKDEYSRESQAMMLASLIAGRGSFGAKDPFWDYEGRKLLYGLIAQSLNVAHAKGETATLSSVIECLFPRSGNPAHAIAQMLNTQKPSAFVERILGNIISAPDNQLGGIVGTAQSYFVALLSGRTQDYLSDSTVPLPQLATRDDYTIYLVIPPSKLESHALLLRLVVGVLLNAILERAPETKPQKTTLFMLDECAQLGEMDELRKAVTLMRGYGVQVWMFFQDLSQLERLYAADYRTLVNNCGVLQTFGLPRKSASEPIAGIIGADAVLDHSSKRDPLDVLANMLVSLDRSQQALSIAGRPIRIARSMRYFRDQPFEGKYDPNPMHNQGDANASGEKSNWVVPRNFIKLKS